MTVSQTETEDLNYGLMLPASPALADTESVVECAVAAEEAGWDGIMPAVPSFSEEEGEALHGLEATGSPEEEVREMLEYYHGLTNEPGEIFLPLDPPGSSAEYMDVCTDLGVTWFYTSELVSSEYANDSTRMMERIRQEPPD